MQIRSSIGAVFIAIAVTAFSGCASLPSPEVMMAEAADYRLPKLPEPNKAIVYVVRPSAMAGLIRFNVFVGDQEPQSEMGYTRSSEYIYFNVGPGQHKIYSKAENWAEMIISAKAGEVIFIQQEPAFGVVMARNNLFRLEDYQGKYHVKTLTLGTVLKTGK